MSLDAILNTPIGYWAVLLGLTVTTCIVLSSMGLLLATVLKQIQIRQVKRLQAKIAKLLAHIARSQQTVNPDISDLCKLLLTEIDNTSDTYLHEMDVIRNKFGVPVHRWKTESEPGVL